MKYYWQGNTLIVSLVILSSLFSFLFMAKDKILSQQKITQSLHYQHLVERFSLIAYLTKDEDKVCQNLQKEDVIFTNYAFSCHKKFIFTIKPTKSYVDYQQINQYLDVESYHNYIYQVNNLSELPLTSLENPKIVRVLNAIDDALSKNFYGIIITDHYFDIKGKYNLYGVLYSSYDNKRKERNLTYKKEVIENIDKQLSSWSYLPFSKRLLPNEKSTD